jgi:hypothetical protein
MDGASFWEADPGPHQSEKPDQDQGRGLRQSEKSDPEPHKSEKMYPDPHQLVWICNIVQIFISTLYSF